MNVNAPIRYSFYTPIKFSKKFIAKRKPIIRALITIGAAADAYAHIGKNYIKACNRKSMPIKNAMAKTAIKIISYILTAFLFPAFALIAKTIYKNWAMKNLPPEKNEEPKQKEIPIKLAISPKMPEPTSCQKKSENVIEPNKKEAPVIEVPDAIPEKVAILQNPLLDKESQERLDRMNHAFVRQENDDYKSVYSTLKMIADIVQQLEKDNKLTFKDELTIKPRAQIKNPLGYGKNNASTKALEVVILGISSALDLGIFGVEVKGEKLFIDEILVRVKQSQSRFVLQKNPSMNKAFNKLYEDFVEKMQKSVLQFADDLNHIPFISKTENEEIVRLNKIRLALPVTDDLLELILSKKIADIPDGVEKQAYRKKFPLLTHKALVNGLPFFKMTPYTLLQDMLSLMKDSHVPLQVKSNLLDLFKTLITCPYYVEDFISSEFKQAAEDFFFAIDNFDHSDFDALKQKKKDVIAMYNEWQSSFEKAIKDEKIALREESSSYGCTKG